MKCTYRCSKPARNKVNTYPTYIKKKWIEGLNKICHKRQKKLYDTTVLT